MKLNPHGVPIGVFTKEVQKNLTRILESYEDKYITGVVDNYISMELRVSSNGLFCDIWNIDGNTVKYELSASPIQETNLIGYYLYCFDELDKCNIKTVIGIDLDSLVDKFSEDTFKYALNYIIQHYKEDFKNV